MSDKSGTEVIERPAVEVLPPEPKKKLEPPKKWHIVLYDPDRETSNCVLCVLMHVFNKSVGDVHSHISELIRDGKTIVFSSSAEVVESKTTQANDRLTYGVCHPAGGGVQFKAERCP